jgi:hypothetical protein
MKSEEERKKVGEEEECFVLYEHFSSSSSLE